MVSTFRLALNSVVPIIILVCCELADGIRFLDNNKSPATERRQSRGISFFPTEDSNQSISPETKYHQDYSHQAYSPTSQYHPQSSPIYPTVSQQQENFRFSNQKRDQNFLNANKVIANNDYNSNKYNDYPYKKYRRPPAPQQLNSEYYEQSSYGDSPYTQPPHQPQLQSLQHYQPHPRPKRPINRPYAGQFNYQRPGVGQLEPGNYFAAQTHPPNYQSSQPSSPPFGGLFNNFQGGPTQGGLPSFSDFFSNLQNGGQFGNFGGQLGKALEDISKHDDYQCVPKVLCQMVGNPRGQTNLPGWVNAPTLTALIAAVPSTSPFLNFGRAALLGLSGGEHSCASAYPRCPRNEDDILHYLNNHRGGFFRFFNRGAAFGDDPEPSHTSQSQYQQQLQYQQSQQQQQQPQSSGLNLETLQSLVETINQGGGINLSNLGSNLGVLSNLASLMGGGGGYRPQQYSQSPTTAAAVTSSAPPGNGIGDFVGNLLTGLVGSRFTSRKISKRSIDDLYDVHNVDFKHGKRASRKRNLNEELVDPFEPVSARSTKKKSSIDYDLLELLRNMGNEYYLGSSNSITSEPFAEKRILNLNQPQIPLSNFFPYQNFEFPKMPYKPSSVAPSHSYTNVFHFPSEREPSAQHIPESYYQNVAFQDQNPNYDRPQMIFPDRTGTGNLRFDNSEFYKPQTSATTNYYQSSIAHKYQPVSVRPVYTNAISQPSYQHQYTKHQSKPDNNIYVTNGKGVVEYYINSQGQKVYT